jgi:hypothetical protein
MDADGFKEFPLHSSTAFPMHLIADAAIQTGPNQTRLTVCLAV